MFRSCLCSASRLGSLQPVYASTSKSLFRAASSAASTSSALASTSNAATQAHRQERMKSKGSSSSVKKAGSYASNVKTQLRQDRSSIIRHTIPDGQAISFSTAERYDIDTLRKALWDHKLLGRGDGNDAMNLMGEAIWIPKWPIEDSPTSSSTSISNSGLATTFSLNNVEENDPQLVSASSSSQSADAPGEIFIFESGSIVAWHMSMAEAQLFLDEVIKKHTTPVEIESYDEPQIEAMEFVVQSGEKTGVKEDMIVIGTTSEAVHDAENEILAENPNSPPLATAIDPLPSASKGTFSLSSSSSSSQLGTWPNPLSHRNTILPRSEDDLRARLSLSSGLARSTKLAVYEEMLDAHMDEVSYIPNALSSGDEGPLKKKDILKNTGNLLRIRQHIYLQEENLIDPPEMFWSNASLEKWFKEMARALDIDLRMRNLKTKVDYSLELQNTLLELNSTKVSHRLEWIIIVLIAIEIVLALMREGLPSFDSRKKHGESSDGTVKKV